MLNHVQLQARIPKSESFKYFFKENEEESHNFWSGFLSCRRNYKAAGKEYPDDDLIECVAFGKTATMINSYFPPGSDILAEGKLFRTEKSETKDGETIWPRLQVQIERVYFTGSSNSSEENSSDSKTTHTEKTPVGNKKKIDFKSKSKAKFGHTKSPF